MYCVQYSTECRTVRALDQGDQGDVHLGEHGGENVATIVRVSASRVAQFLRLH